MGETAILAKYLANLQYENLNNRAVKMAKKVFLDWLGVAIAGSVEKPAKLIRKVVLPYEASKEATIFDGGFKKQGSALHAAMVNGSSSHTLDFDDLHNPSIIHLATVTVPVALALSERERNSGKDFIRSIVAGYELGARVGESVLPDSYYYWHLTGTAGTLAAVGSAATALHLSESDYLNAIGSAGTQASGLWDFLKDGAMSKPLHTAKACYAGVLSAYLAKEGFTASSTILEGEKGFCKAMMKTPLLDKLTESLGQDLKIVHNSFKPYPCCKHSHAAIWGIKKIITENNIEVRDISNITILVNSMTNSLINNPNPLTPYGGKFSIQYCVAVMMLHNKLTIKDFNENLLHQLDVRKLMKKITVVFDEEMESINQKHPEQLASSLRITLKSGQTYDLFVPFPKGDPENELTFEELSEKFTSLVEPFIGLDEAQSLIGKIKCLEEIPDMREFFSITEI